MHQKQKRRARCRERSRSGGQMTDVEAQISADEALARRIQVWCARSAPGVEGNSSRGNRVSTVYFTGKSEQLLSRGQRVSWMPCAGRSRDLVIDGSVAVFYVGGGWCASSSGGLFSGLLRGAAMRASSLLQTAMPLRSRAHFLNPSVRHLQNCASKPRLLCYPLRRFTKPSPVCPPPHTHHCAPPPSIFRLPAAQKTQATEQQRESTPLINFNNRIAAAASMNVHGNDPLDSTSGGGDAAGGRIGVGVGGGMIQAGSGEAEVPAARRNVRQASIILLVAVFPIRSMTKPAAV